MFGNSTKAKLLTVDWRPAWCIALRSWRARHFAVLDQWSAYRSRPEEWLERLTNPRNVRRCTERPIRTAGHPGRRHCRSPNIRYPRAADPKERGTGPERISCTLDRMVVDTLFSILAVPTMACRRDHDIARKTDIATIWKRHKWDEEHDANNWNWPVIFFSSTWFPNFYNSGVEDSTSVAVFFYFKLMRE